MVCFLRVLPKALKGQAAETTSLYWRTMQNRIASHWRTSIQEYPAETQTIDSCNIHHFDAGAKGHEQWVEAMLIPMVDWTVSEGQPATSEEKPPCARLPQSSSRPKMRAE